MVGKSVAEKAAEKKAAAAQSAFTDDGFKVVGELGKEGARNFLSFAKQEEGFQLIGTYMGIKEDGKFGPEMMVEDAAGVMQISVVSVGLKGIRQVPIGKVVRITCEGLKQTRNGKTFRAFKIEMKE